MKKITTLLTLILCFSIVLLTAFAEGVTNWADYDWENFSIKTVEDEEWESMLEWFRADAELSIVFYVSCRSDGFYAEGISWVLYERFSREPAEFIHALSLENAETTERVIRNVIYYGGYNKEECEKLLSSLVLPENATDAEREVLRGMIAYAEQRHDMQITNPKTADNAQLFAALVGMLVCGTGLIVARRRIV